jgi:hypothetical protein
MSNLNFFLVLLLGVFSSLAMALSESQAINMIKTNPDLLNTPQVLITSSGMQVAKDISSVLYQFAITAASLKTVGAF